MEGAFSEGSVLWWWYDTWVVVPSAALALILTYRAMFEIRLASHWATLASLIALAGTTLAILVSFERASILTLTIDPVLAASLSMAGAGVAVLAGIAIMYEAHRGASRSASAVKQRGAKTSVRSAAKAAAKMRPVPKRQMRRRA
ncbi:MAG: hypothetical protein O2854_07300 [Chloroflexi bacterium]|nr:hypothetical protein [Chloroflexota bacterium]